MPVHPGSLQSTFDLNAIRPPQGLIGPAGSRAPVTDPNVTEPTSLLTVPRPLPNVAALGPSSPPSGGEALLPVSNPPKNEEEKNRWTLGWKEFIERFKEDPNLRVAMLQTVLGLTQPAGNPAEAVGRSIQGGLRTLETLEDRDFSQAQQARATEIQEGTLELQKQQLAQGQTQFEAELSQDADQFGATATQRADEFKRNLQQQQDELKARLSQLKSDATYQRDLITVRREEIAGGQGAVNQRWTRLTNVLMATQPELFGDGPEAFDLAQAYAHDLLQGGQDRAKIKASLMQDALGLAPLPDQSEDPTAYSDALRRISQNADAILDAAGFQDTQIFPGTPEAPAEVAGTGALVPGDVISLPGAGQGTVVAISEQSVTVDFGAQGTRVMNRVLVEADGIKLNDPAAGTP